MMMDKELILIRHSLKINNLKIPSYNHPHPRHSLTEREGLEKILQEGDNEYRRMSMTTTIALEV